MSRFYEYRRRDLLGALIFGSCFYLLAKLSVSLPGKSGDISYIWLANGLAVGLLMRLKPNHWLPYVVAAFIGDISNNLQLDYPWWLTLLYGAIDAGQAPISVAILQLFIPRPIRIDSIRNLLVWCAVSVVAVNGVFSLIGATVAALAMADDYWLAWRNWFIGGVMGLLTMAPFVVSWTHEKFLATIKKIKENKLELAALIVCLIITTSLIFSSNPTNSALTFHF
jgi:integral membrane sensor domain MASE1